jgi:hypothetical protein
MKRPKESPEHYLSRATSRALSVCQAKAKAEGREATMEEIAASLNAVPTKPPKRKKSRGRDSKWYHFHFLTMIQLRQYQIAELGKKPFDPYAPGSYTKDFVFDLNDIDIEGIVQSIPEHGSRERIMEELREAIEDKLNQIALLEAVLVEVTKWNWEETSWGDPDYYKTDGKIKIEADQTAIADSVIQRPEVLTHERD